MHTPSRARRLLMWTGVGLSLLVIGLWVAGQGYEAAVVVPGNIVLGFDIEGLSASTANVDVRTYAKTTIRRHGRRGKNFDRRMFFHSANWGYGRNATTVQIFTLPFGLALSATTLATVLLWYRDRRRVAPGRCLRCEYDLTGNRSGICSECGEPVAVAR